MARRRSQSDSRAERELALAHAALRLLAKEQWPKLTLGGIARAAKLPLGDAVALTGSKVGVVGLVLRMLAGEAASRYSAAPASGDPRERLFDVTMTFFDVQTAHAPALRKLYRSLQYDPATLLALRSDVLALSGDLLALAEADFGPSPRLQAGVFAGILLRATSVWRDDDPEMGNTMARLDGDLRRSRQLLWPKLGTAGVPPAATKKSGRNSRGSRKKAHGPNR